MSEKRFGGNGEPPTSYQWAWHTLNLQKDDEERRDNIQSIIELALNAVNPEFAGKYFGREISTPPEGSSFAKDVGKKIGGPVGEKVAELLAKGAPLEEIERLASQAGITL